MTFMHCAIWGAFATIVLTTLLAGSQGLGYTRINVPFLLGTILTPNRDRAKVYGVLVHLVNGIIFAWVYALAFAQWHGATWWKGAILGTVHGTFLLAFGVTFLPAIHPRMASERQGPTAMRQLEPPGFLGLHYGRRTPIAVLAAHVVYGIILGAFFRGA